MKTWKYMVCYFDGNDFEKELNYHGSRGWELVAVTSDVLGVKLVFKTPA